MQPTPERSKLNANDAVLAAACGVLGLVVRLAPALASDFPLNDGGLFYSMILDLQANGLRVPFYTTYNSAHIPFVYPPLGIYAAALLSPLLRANVLDILRILPALVSALCVPAFYYLARQILGGRQPVVLAATIAFALTPRAFEWQIMGGGITRSFGLLFALLSIRSAHALFSGREPRAIWWTGLWGALTILSHPEAALQAALACLIIYLVLDRSRGGALRAAAAIGIALLLSAPWWAMVISRFGIAPFLAAFAAARGGTTVDFPARLFLTFQFSFTEELFLPFIAVLGLLGLFRELAQRRWLLPVWVIVPLFVEPRSAPQYMVIPLAMLAAIGLAEIILPAFGFDQAQGAVPGRKTLGWLLAYLTAYLLLSAYLTSANIAARVTLRAPDRAAFDWVRAQTPPDSQFILITAGNALADPWVEWFPALTQRRSLDTVFGSEWTQDLSFRTRIAQYDQLQACLVRDESCLAAWRQSSGLTFTHVLIRKSDSASSVLLESLRRSAGYRLLYESPTIAIFTAP